jgi:hypothetical protein
MQKNSTNRKEKLPMKVSPIGEIRYAWLKTPRPPYKGKDTDSGKYSVTLAFSSDDIKMQAWVKEIKALYPDGTKWPWKKDEETGNTLVTFKSTYRPRMVDAKRNPLPDGCFPSRDSVVKVAYVPNVYEDLGGGVNLYLQGIQVIELVEYESAPLPFEEEDGYVAAPADDTGKQRQDEPPAWEAEQPTSKQEKDYDSGSLPF